MTGLAAIMENTVAFARASANFCVFDCSMDSLWLDSFVCDSLFRALVVWTRPCVVARQGPGRGVVAFVVACARRRVIVGHARCGILVGRCVLYLSHIPPHICARRKRKDMNFWGTCSPLMV